MQEEYVGRSGTHVELRQGRREEQVPKANRTPSSFSVGWIILRATGCSTACQRNREKKHVLAKAQGKTRMTYEVASLMDGFEHLSVGAFAAFALHLIVFDAT